MESLCRGYHLITAGFLTRRKTYFAFLLVLSLLLSVLSFKYLNYKNNDLIKRLLFLNAAEVLDKISPHHNNINMEPHTIMSRQYDVPFGTYQDVPYKKILFWHRCRTPTAFPESFGIGLGRDVFKRAGCPVWQCETSSDRSNLTDYDAILFDFISFNKSDLPATRSSNQRYILFDFESPVYNISGDKSLWRGDMIDLFNWTMNYRWDSDVAHPYGWIQPIGFVPLHPTEDAMRQLLKEDRPRSINYALKNTKMAAWMASNKCRDSPNTNDRNFLITKLIEYGIEIDIYGECGNLTCGTSNYHHTNYKTDETDEPCREMIGDTYKFYFALESANCLDYVTEKFYAMMRKPIILVVIDDHGNNARIAPPHSFINALDFPSVRHLADYLKELDVNDTLYNEYFWWKEHFVIRNSLLSGMFYKTFCTLCAALHDPPVDSVQKVYNDMVAWWIDDAHCKSPFQLRGIIN